MPRILYVPMYSSPRRMKTDSTHNWAKLFFQTVVEDDPEAFVYCPIPEGFANEYSELDHPRIHLFPVPMFSDESQYMESGRLQELYVNKFSDVAGPNYADIVVCDKASVLPVLKMGLEFWFKGAAAPKVYLSKTHFIFDSEAIYALSKDFEITQSLGYAMADSVLWMSDGDYDRGYHLASKYLSASMLKDMEESKLLGGWLANFPALEQVEHDPMDKPRDKINLSWAYGGNTDYHVKQILEIYDLVYKMSENVGVLLTSSGAAGAVLGKLLREYTYIEKHHGLPQLKFFEKLKEAHIFIYWPNKPHTSPSTVMEQQMMGLVGVFQANTMKPTTLYPDYPYLAKNRNEMINMVKWLSEHYFDDEVQEVIRLQKEYIQSKYDPRDDARRIYAALLDQLAVKKKRLEKGRANLVDLLAEVTVGLPEVTLDQLVLLIKKQSKIGMNLRDINTLPHIGMCLGLVRHLMELVGFRDKCDGLEVRFARVDND